MPLTEATESSFDQEIQQNDMPIVVDFWAEWCGPCRMLLPVLEEAATQLEGKVRIIKVNIDKSPQIAARYNVRSIPTLALIQNGQVHSTKVGFVNKSKFIEWVESAAS